MTEEDLFDAAKKASIFSKKVYEEWENDSTINELNLQAEAANCPKLHSKYSNFLRDEINKLNIIEAYCGILDKKLYHFYTNKGPQESNINEIKKMPAGKIIKSEYDKYIQGDLDYIEWKLKTETQKSKVDFLKNVLFEIGRRHYHITNIFNEKKYNSGN